MTHQSAINRLTRTWLLVFGLSLLVACGSEQEQAADNRPGRPGGFGPGGAQVIPAVEVVEARRGALPLEERLT
ncbi:MAG TPA: hypothetical protein DD407_13085, partial [Pseudohongiella sp.]|nr:hypothetical protein [Pseudohongiella sp.]